MDQVILVLIEVLSDEHRVRRLVPQLAIPVQDRGQARDVHRQHIEQARRLSDGDRGGTRERDEASGESTGGHGCCCSDIPSKSSASPSFMSASDLRDQIPEPERCVKNRFASREHRWDGKNRRT
jgi:hypothetical protein